MEITGIDRQQKVFGAWMVGLGIAATAISFLTQTNLMPEIYIFMVSVLFLAFSLLLFFGTRKILDLPKIVIPEGVGALIVFFIGGFAFFGCIFITVESILRVLIVVFNGLGVVLLVGLLEKPIKKIDWWTLAIIASGMNATVISVITRGNGTSVWGGLFAQGVAIILTGFAYMKACPANRKTSGHFVFLSIFIPFLLMQMFYPKLIHINDFQNDMAKQGIKDVFEIELPDKAKNVKMRYGEHAIDYTLYLSFEVPSKEAEQWIASGVKGLEKDLEQYYTLADAHEAEQKLAATKNKAQREALLYNGKFDTVDEAFERKKIWRRPLWWKRNIGDDTRYTCYSDDESSSDFILYIEPKSDGWAQVWLYSQYNGWLYWYR